MKNLGDALFPKARAALLALLFGHPDRSFYLREIVTKTGLGVGHVQRELARLSDAGLLVRSRVGRSVHFQANPRCPIFDELRGIVAKTSGAVGPLRRALEPLAERVDVAFVFGSVARGEERETSDLDLMVIGNASFSEVVGAIRDAERMLGRAVNPTVYPVEEVRHKLAAHHHFLTKVIAGKKLFVLGGEDELAAVSR